MQRKHEIAAVVPAFAVHLLTASGAALALLALLAATERDWALMFAVLGVALVVDGVDGFLARRFRVRDVLPRWSGEILDLVVDVLTYVFVPAYALAASDVLPHGWRAPLAILIVLSSVIYFADRRMKTADHHFVGFPAVWNVVAFYLFLMRPGPWICAVIVAALVALTFAPVSFVHPFRVARWRALTIAMLAAWAVLAVIAVVQDLRPPAWVSVLLCAIGVYFCAAGLVQTVHVRRTS